jgi:hypothetical protein
MDGASAAGGVAELVPDDAEAPAALPEVAEPVDASLEDDPGLDVAVVSPDSLAAVSAA